MNEEFKKHWKKQIKNYGKGFGRIYNGLSRRKAIAKKFYTQGILDTNKDINKSLKTKSLGG